MGWEAQSKANRIAYRVRKKSGACVQCRGQRDRKDRLCCAACRDAARQRYLAKKGAK